MSWRLILAVLVMLMLAGCNGPSPGMIGTPGVSVTSGGATFNVFIRGARAEAVRTNFEFPAHVASVFPRARAAIEQVSGCLVRPGSMTGDAALIRAEIQC